MSIIKYQGKSYSVPWVREGEKLVAKSTPAPHTASGEFIKFRRGTVATGDGYMPVDFAKLDDYYLELLKKAASK